MIKVYLDWNCITHTKDLFPELKELLARYSHVFICPYGVAHLRDIQTISSSNPKEYEKDLDLLTQICGVHMLLCSGNDMQLLNVKPRDYLSDSGDFLDILQNKFPFPYDFMRKLFRTVFAPKDLQSIAKENDPTKVFQLANDTVEKTLGIDISTLLGRANNTGKTTLELKMRQDYYALDMLGYKSEDKKKSFANIDTDAHHIYLAAFCDFLISNDKKMRDKASSIYSNYHCVTKVMDVHSFMNEMPRIVEKCYESELIPNAMQTNGFPRMEEDGAHYMALDYPLWGTFKFCYNAITLNSSMPRNVAYFMPGQFMFYDELRPLAVMTSLWLPESQREKHIENYIQSYIQSKPIGNIAFTLNSPAHQYDCVLMSYNSLPALQVTVK